MNSKLTQIKVFNVQSESLSNQKTKTGEDTLQAITTNEYIYFRLENSMADILVHQNKIRMGVNRQYGIVSENKQLSMNIIILKRKLPGSDIYYTTGELVDSLKVVLHR